MKLVQYKESFCAFDGKIILKINVEKPEEVCNRASEYIESFSKYCLLFAQNALQQTIIQEYNNCFVNGEKFAPYFYRLCIFESVIGNAYEYTFHAALIRSGITVAQGSKTVRFQNDCIIPHRFTFSKEKKRLQT